MVAPTAKRCKTLMLYPITPIPKPRMTRADKWKKRPAVLRYWAFKDECILNKITLQSEGASVTFIMPMPKSWSVKKSLTFLGKPHTQKPDLDNLLKALQDALFDDDSGIHSITIKKIWGDTGAIIIESESL